MIEFFNALLTILSHPGQLLLIVVSVLGGYMIGVLPGLGVIFGIVVLLPFTLKLPPELGIATLMAVFVGSACGGGLTATLLGIPGTPMATATLLDAHPMAKKGDPGRAIGFVVIASVFGGIVSAIILAVFAPFLARVALNFGPPEYVLLVALGLTTVAFVSHGAFIKGMLAALLGLSIATIGTDIATTFQRFTFGVPQLVVGFNMIPVLLGLFAIPEIISMLERKNECMDIKVGKIKPKWLKKKDWRDYLPTFIKSSFIGTTVGALPGAGADIAAFLSYGEAKRSSKHPEKYGTGIPEGVIASEAANNAVTGGALIPMLTLGIPGDAAIAIIMGALFMHGIAPGPNLYQIHGSLLAYIYVGLFLANIALLIIGMYASRPFISLCGLHRAILIPIIMLLCVLGVWAIQTSIFDLWIMLAFGILSYILRKLQFPLAPVILGYILGPLFEQNLRRTLTISGGDFSIFITRPYSLLIIAIFALVLYGLFKTVIKKETKKVA